MTYKPEDYSPWYPCITHPTVVGLYEIRSTKRVGDKERYRKIYYFPLSARWFLYVVALRYEWRGLAKRSKSVSDSLGLFHDRIHTDTGRARAAKSFKYRKPK